MPSSSKHLIHFEGGNALSAFRAQALLPRLQAVNERIHGIHARHVHRENAFAKYWEQNVVGAQHTDSTFNEDGSK